MINCNLFLDITEEEQNLVFKCFNCKNLFFKKGQYILSNVASTGTIGIVITGVAQLIKIDYYGNRTLLAEYNSGDIFGNVFSNIDNGEIYIISKTDTDILFMDYDKLINRCKKNCPCHNTIIQNMMQIFAKRIYEQNERIEILAKRSIRDKLLKYFNSLSKKNRSKIIYLPFTYTDLADYLSIDRASMMREIKNLKDDGLIFTKNKMIKLLY